MSRQSLTKAHAKISELTWEPTFATPATRFGTDYTFEKAPKKDPLKQIMRSYFPMEEEKDNRVYGAMDGAIRGNMFRQVQQRWLEWQKLFLSIIPFPEISAARAMPMAIDAVPNPEIHNGLAVQMIDEVRHSTIQMNLKKLYMNNYIDPAGFDMTEKAFANNYAGTIGRQFGEGFITGDAITAANIYLTVVAETAFTNTLFVAMPDEAAANGDYLLPTVFHSVQSDESRHISNGYSILLMALADERRKNPQDDIVTKLINAHVDERGLTEDEFGFFVMMLAVAGNETTRNAITHGMNAFFDNPDQWELWKAERPDTMVDEVVRWASPISVFQRTAKTDVEIGGVTVKKDQRVGLFYASANFDEDVFTDPFRFDITRDPNPQLGFGGHGAHYCLGANLARQEIRLIFHALADLAPDISSLAEPARLRHSWVNGIKDLQVSYS
nr:cytochrome P450 [uncultured Rhodococcus sp.]